MNLPPLPLLLLLLLLFMLLLLLLLVLEAAAALLVGSGACQQQQRALPLLLRPPPLDRNFASSFRSAAQVHLRRPKRPVQALRPMAEAKEWKRAITQAAALERRGL